MIILYADKCLFTCRHSVHGDWRVQSTSGIQAFWWYSVLWSVSMDCRFCCNRTAFMSGEPNSLHAINVLAAFCFLRQDSMMRLLLCASASATPSYQPAPPPFASPILPPLPDPLLVSVFNMPAGHAQHTTIPASSLVHSAGLRLLSLS